MIEMDVPEISVEVIKEKIAQEVKRYQATMPSPSRDNDFCFSPCPDLSQWFAPPANEELPLQDEYRLEQLLAFHDTAFIQNAYTALLRRPPDTQGNAVYLERLRNGSLTKVDILGRLRYSREGRTKKIPVRGLTFKFFLRTAAGIPVAGHLLQMVIAILHLPAILKSIRALENRLHIHIHDTKTQIQRNREHLMTLRDHVAEMQEQIVQGRTDRLARIHSRMEELSTKNKELEQKFTLLAQTAHDYKRAILPLQRTFTSFMEEMRNTPRNLSVPSQPLSTLEGEEMHLLDPLYTQFENQFRGSRKAIRKRIKRYIPLIKKALHNAGGGPVLDLGCGRGEWLELLREHDIQAKGLDLNRIMVSQCRDLDLDVACMDVISHLRQQKDHTYGTITGFHIIEHLPFHTQITLLDETLRVLKSGGMVLFETPNPENILVGACTFYTDPTHIRPIPPVTAAFLMKERGFTDVSILRINVNPTIKLENPFLQEQFATGQDYAVMGYRP